MKNNKIAIIIYKTDNNRFRRLCNEVLNGILLPEGYTVDLLEVSNEEHDIGKAYNEAMASNDATYKLFVSEHLEWVARDTLLSMLEILDSSEDIGMVGVDGHNQAMTEGAFTDKAEAALTEDGIQTDIISLNDSFVLTDRDIEWREGVFETLSVLVNSQCLEYIKTGCKVSGLPKEKEWVRADADQNSEKRRNDTERYLDDYSGMLFPLVSILIPTHERPDLFKIALDSALAQTYRHTEIIISDNSMDDRTEQLMAQYLSQYDNINYLRVPGMGANDNWENCWKHISPDSEYTNFLMDDDVFMPNKIAEMMNYFLMNPGITLVTSYRQLIDGDGNILPDAGFNARIVPNTTFIKGEEAGRQILLNCTNWIGEPTTVLYKTKLMVDYLQGWTGREKYALHDYSMWLRLLEHGDMVYITEPLSQFRQHGNNDSKDFKLNIYGTSSMATVIQEAWNKKVYLNTANLLKRAILSWYRMSNGMIMYCFDNDVECEEFDDLLIVYNEMSKAFTDKEPGDIVFDFPYPQRRKI